MPSPNLGKSNRDANISPAGLARFEPYKAELKDGVWHVQGAPPPNFTGRIPVASECAHDEGGESLSSVEAPLS